MPRKQQKKQAINLTKPWRPLGSKVLAVLGLITYLVFTTLYTMDLMTSPWWILAIPTIWGVAYLVYASEIFCKIAVYGLCIIIAVLPFVAIEVLNDRMHRIRPTDENQTKWNLIFLQGFGIILAVFFMNNLRRVNWSMTSDHPTSSNDPAPTK